MAVMNWIGKPPTSLFDVTTLDVGERHGRFGRIILSVAGVTLNDKTKYTDYLKRLP